MVDKQWRFNYLEVTLWHSPFTEEIDRCPVSELIATHQTRSDVLIRHINDAEGCCLVSPGEPMIPGPRASI